MLDRWTTIDDIPHMREHLAALDTWRRFANGDNIDVQRLGEIIDILDNIDDHQHRHRRLADAVKQYCRDAGIHLPTPEPEVPGIEPLGLDIGL